MDKKIIIAIGAAVTGLVVLRYALFSEPETTAIKLETGPAASTPASTGAQAPAANPQPSGPSAHPAVSGPAGVQAPSGQNPAAQIAEPVIKPNSGAQPPTGPAATPNPAAGSAHDGPAGQSSGIPSGQPASIGTPPDPNQPSIASPPTGQRPIITDYQGEPPQVSSPVSGVAGSAAPGLSPAASQSTGPSGNPVPAP